MTIGIYIDNNVWDFLYERDIDLSVALPREEFVICITREAEFEIPPIAATNSALAAFIATTINKCLIETDVFFGFNDDSLPPSEQREGGFNFGRFANPEELAFMAQQRTPLKPRHSIKNLKTRLYKDEADIALATRSFHAIVLSLDAKKGPINKAYQQGGKIVFLKDFDLSGMLLADFIRSKLTEHRGRH